MPYDVFISYTHNEDPPDWVQRFEERICARVNSHYTRQLQVYRDVHRNGAEPLPEVLAALDASRSLLVVSSPVYRGSIWGVHEVERFIANRGLRGIFKIDKLPVHHLDQRESLRSHVGYKFWTGDLEEPVDLLADQLEYHRTITALIHDLYHFLFPPAAGAKVLLLHDESTRIEERNRLKAHLESHGYGAVLPGRLPRLFERNQLEEVAREAHCAVVLFGSKHSTALAANWNIVSRVIPSVADFSIEGMDDAQKELRASIERQQDDRTLRVQLWEQGTLELQNELIRLLKHRPEEAARPTVYLVSGTDGRERNLSACYRRDIEAQGFDVIASTDDSTVPRGRRHRDALERSHGVILLEAYESKNLLNAMMGELRRARGFSTEFDKAVAGPTAACVERNAENLGYDVLIGDAPDFTDTLRRFLERVRDRAEGRRAA